MKIRNIVFIITILIALLMALCTVTYATSINPDDFKPPELDATDATEAIELSKKIIGGITAVGTVVAVVVTMVLGIKYITGSVEEKAEYKKTMTPILVGMVLLFGVSWIIQLLYDVISKIDI